MNLLDQLIVLAGAARTRSYETMSSFRAGYELGFAHGLEKAHDLILKDQVDNGGV